MKTDKLIFWILVAVGGLAAIAAVVFHFTKPKPSGKKPEAGSPEQLEKARQAKAKIKEDLKAELVALGIEFPADATANDLRSLLDEAKQQTNEEVPT